MQYSTELVTSDGEVIATYEDCPFVFAYRQPITLTINRITTEHPVHVEPVTKRYLVKGVEYEAVSTGMKAIVKIEPAQRVEITFNRRSLHQGS